MERDTASLIAIADLSPLLNPLHRSPIGPGNENRPELTHASAPTQSHSRVGGWEIAPEAAFSSVRTRRRDAAPDGRAYSAHERRQVCATDRQDDTPSRWRTTLRRRVGDASTS